MTTGTSHESVKKSLRIWAGIRIGYGVAAIFAPQAMFRLLRMAPHPDARGFNAFLGSRDIVVGVVSLQAASRDEVATAARINHGNELIDTIVIARELRAGRGADVFSLVGVVFNTLGHLTWLRARKHLR